MTPHDSFVQPPPSKDATARNFNPSQISPRYHALLIGARAGISAKAPLHTLIIQVEQSNIPLRTRSLLDGNPPFLVPTRKRLFLQGERTHILLKTQSLTTDRHPLTAPDATVRQRSVQIEQTQTLLKTQTLTAGRHPLIATDPTGGPRFAQFEQTQISLKTQSLSTGRHPISATDPTGGPRSAQAEQTHISLKTNLLTLSRPLLNRAASTLHQLPCQPSLPDTDTPSFPPPPPASTDSRPPRPPNPLALLARPFPSTQIPPSSDIIKRAGQPDRRLSTDPSQSRLPKILFPCYPSTTSPCASALASSSRMSPSPSWPAAATLSAAPMAPVSPR